MLICSLSWCVGNPVAFHLGADALGRRRNRCPQHGSRAGIWQHGGISAGDRTDTPQRSPSPDLPGRGITAHRSSREAAGILRCTLSPLAAPRPTTDTEIDLRTTAQRDADALVELAARALNDGELPTEGGERPQVVGWLGGPARTNPLHTAPDRMRLHQ